MIGDGPAAAVDALSAAVGAEPGRGELWSELATALVAAGRASEAWDAAVRAVELAPRSAASHRAIGTVAAALGDSAQAESAYRHAQLLDPTAGASGSGGGGGRHASDRADALATWMASQIAAPDPGRGRAPGAEAPPGPANGSRHAAPDQEAPASGRHGVPEPSSGGRRRAPEVDRPVDPQPPTGGRRGAPEDSEPAPQSSYGRRRAGEDGPATAVWPAGTVPGPDGGPATAVWPAGRNAAAHGGEAAWPVGDVQRGTAVGLPAWLGPSATTRGPGGQPRAVPTGATRVTDPETWRRGLITVVRIEWLVGVVCFLGLAYARTAPYTAGLLAGALVVAGAYGRLRWRSIATLRPPEPDRIPTYAAVAAVATAVVIIPAAMAGGLTLARLAAVAAVTSATVAAVLLAR